MADLSGFLRAITSGNTTFTPEMYAHFGGDDILAKLRKYDPDAQWTDTIGNDEGQVTGKRLDFDVTKLPKSKAGTAGLDLRNSNFGSLKNPNAVFSDDVYGDVTNSANVAKPTDPLWTKLAPLVVGLGGPMAGAALAGMGIGGAAGLTAGVTGSGLSGSAPSWLVSLVKNGPGTVGKVSNGNFDLMSLLPYLGHAAGINPNLIKGGMTLQQLAGRR